MFLDADGNRHSELPMVDQTAGAWHSPRGPLEVTDGEDDYESVGTSATDQVLGDTGAVGDYLKTLVVIVATSGANGTCSIKDGDGSAISIVPASAPVGTHVFRLGIRSKAGAWKVTTGSAATALAIGDFS